MASLMQAVSGLSSSRTCPDLFLLRRGRELAHDRAVGQLDRDREEGAAQVDHEAVDLAGSRAPERRPRCC